MMLVFHEWMCRPAYADSASYISACPSVLNYRYFMNFTTGLQRFLRDVCELEGPQGLLK